MLDYNDYKKIHEIRENNPEIYDLIKKISNYCLETASHGCHDLRNHAALISSYCQLLTMTNPAIAKDSYFQKIELSTKNLLNLFYEIAQFRYSFKNSDLNEASLQSLIQSVIQKTREQFSDLSIDISCSDTIPAEKDRILCNSSHMTEALFAILKNSVEACSPDSIHISINTSYTEGFLILTVTDNGCGFSDNMLTDACQPFITEWKNHSGLGLALASTVVYKHNGNLTLSNTDAGAKVTIILPN